MGQSDKVLMEACQNFLDEKILKSIVLTHIFLTKHNVRHKMKYDLVSYYIWIIIVPSWTHSYTNNASHKILLRVVTQAWKRVLVLKLSLGEVFTECDAVGLPGTLVPRATNEIAVIESFSPTVQPKADARSPMNAVSTPIIPMDTQKQAQPPQ